MKKDYAILSALLFLVITFLAVFFLIARQADEISERDFCRELGCPEYARFVGSKNSNVFHSCDCRYASSIKPENVVCFMNRTDAEQRGYREAEVC